ncbi:MAG: hypothetical protein RLZZ76_31 [Candidatus Parcubacteria bacterium]|jgi:hypothetical protein
MALCIPCKYCGRFEVTHSYKHHPADEAKIADTCEKFEPVSELVAREQLFLRKMGYSWQEILAGKVSTSLRF